MSYKARAVIRCSGVVSGNAALNSSFSTNVPTNVISGTNFNSNPIAIVDGTSASNTWTQSNITFNASQNSSYVIFAPVITTAPVPVRADCGNVYVYFDDVRLEKVGNQITTYVTASTSNPKVGQNVIFTMQLCNTGSVTVSNVSLTNLLPAGFSVISSTFSAYPNHIFSSIASGACVNVSVTAQAQPTVAFNTDISDCAGVTSPNACVQSQACKTVRVLATNISISASQLQPACNKLSVVISNTGTIDAHNVKVNYTPPACFGYMNVYSVAPFGAATYAANLISVPVIAPGSSVTLEFTGAAIIAGGCINNPSLSLTSPLDEYDTNINDNGASVTFVQCGACLNLPRIQ